MKSAPLKKAKSSSKARLNKNFPIVAIGASVGGLEAVSELLKNLPSDTGMAYIFVQHLNPNYKSVLTEILSKTTGMHVHEVDKMGLINPNNVYVIPHDKGIEVTDGHIRSIPRSKNSSAISIDVLFSSLAKTHKENVIGVVLSGNASDGTLGLKAIKEVGGLTFAQDSSAQASSMPKSAIASGAVDFVLSPKGIAKKLIQFSKSGLVNDNAKNKGEVIEDYTASLKDIFELLHKETGVDFSHYKMPTIKRRLNNKMLQCGVKTIKEYSKLLLKKNNEVDLLYKDLLINVTNFFRDKDTFNYLKTTFLPNLLKSKTIGETIRIWIPACSTGQEAYSIAMLISELQDGKTKKIPVQIFATDLSDRVIHDARLGEYSLTDIKSVPKKYLTRFFNKIGDKYSIVKELREMCVFAPHNILRDPPFSRMDFISCRNLLIYFDSAAQKKVFATLHFALVDGGHLILGKAETVGTSSSLFSKINNKFKIYSRKKNSGILRIPELIPHLPRTNFYNRKVSNPAKTVNTNISGVENAIDSLLLEGYMPACAVVNKDMDILQFRGPVSIYLTHRSGKANLNILKMVRPEFAFELRNAINKVIKSKQSVKKSGIEIKVESVFRMMTFEVCSLKVEWEEPLVIVIFTLQEQIEKIIEDGKGGKNSSILKDRKIKKLTDELNNTRAEMNSIIESQEATYEELQAANEEVVSTNEEFQTLNEELETSKEEIEATNEELISTNQEIIATNHQLQMHNELLTESYEYSEAIITTVHEPMLILDKDFHVKSANKSFYKKFLVKKEETEGFFLFELGNKQWDIPKLRQLLHDVFSKNTRFESFEVTHTFQGIGEKVMLLNANPIIQKTHKEKLILLAIEDITERSTRQKKADGKNKEDIRIHVADKLILEKAVATRTTELVEKNIEFEKANKKLIFQNKEKEKRAAELIVANKELLFQNKEKEKRAAELIVANKELIFQNKEKEKRAAELIVANKELIFQNDEKEKRAEELSVANQDLTAFTYISSHDLQEPLRKIQTFATLILAGEEEKLSEQGKSYFQKMMKTSRRMQQLIEDLLIYSRTKSSERVFESTDFNILLNTIEKDLAEVIKKGNVTIEHSNLHKIKIIPSQFRQLLHNLISNSIKFSKPNSSSHIKIESKLDSGNKLNPKLTAKQKYHHISVKDNGIGFDAQYKERIFEVFQRLHTIDQYSGTGIGLAICKRIAENHNGIITASSKLGEGAQFDIYIPEG